MNDPLERLAGYFQQKEEAPPGDFAGLAREAREAGHTWAGIAAACGTSGLSDMTLVAGQPSGSLSDHPGELFYRAATYAIERATRSHRRSPPLTWHCSACGRQVTDRSGSGRPVHVEHGHAPGCARLARDQAADDARRRATCPPCPTALTRRAGGCNGTTWPNRSPRIAPVRVARLLSRAHDHRRRRLGHGHLQQPL